MLRGEDILDILLLLAQRLRGLESLPQQFIKHIDIYKVRGKICSMNEHVDLDHFPESHNEEVDAKKWRVLYTKSRHEKFVENQLLQKGIEAFTPKVNIRRSWSDRIKLIEEPLFKGYCFAKFYLKDKIKIISQLGVAGLVHFNKQYIAVEELVISSLKVLATNDIEVDYHPYLNVGDKVFIKAGPLKGLEGYIVEKRDKSTTIVISVDAIQSSIKFVTDACFAEVA